MADNSTPVKRKRVENNENIFVNVFSQLPLKRTRRVLPKDDDPVLIAEHRRVVEERTRRQLEETQLTGDGGDLLAVNDAEGVARLRAAVISIKEVHGYKTLNDFITDLLQTRDQHLSSQVTKLVERHGLAYLESMRARCPEQITKWAIEITVETVASEGSKLTQLMCPSSGSVSDRIKSWSLPKVMSEAKEVAPTIYRLLQATGECEKQGNIRRDRDLVGF